MYLDTSNEYVEYGEIQIGNKAFSSSANWGRFDRYPQQSFSLAEPIGATSPVVYVIHP